MTIDNYVFIRINVLVFLGDLTDVCTVYSVSQVSPTFTARVVQVGVSLFFF